MGALFPEYRPFNYRLGTARSLVERQPDAAVVVAQMAFEAFVEFAVSELQAARPEAQRETGPVGHSLMADADRTAWTRLSGQSLKKRATDGAYQRYTEHVHLRNRVAHNDALATPEQARESLAAVGGMVELMIDAARKTSRAAQSWSPEP